jgi:hypothetical protein
MGLVYSAEIMENSQKKELLLKERVQAICKELENKCKRQNDINEIEIGKRNISKLPPRPFPSGSGKLKLIKLSCLQQKEKNISNLQIHNLPNLNNSLLNKEVNKPKSNMLDKKDLSNNNIKPFFIRNYSSENLKESTYNHSPEKAFENNFLSRISQSFKKRQNTSKSKVKLLLNSRNSLLNSINDTFSKCSTKEIPNQLSTLSLKDSLEQSFSKEKIIDRNILKCIIQGKKVKIKYDNFPCMPNIPKIPKPNLKIIKINKQD